METPSAYQGSLCTPYRGTWMPARHLTSTRSCANTSALQPTPGSRHGERRTFKFKELDTASHVFIRHDAVRGPLQPPYDGPYKVVSRSDKTFVVTVRGRDTTVSIERLKPAFILEESDMQLLTPEEDDDLPSNYRNSARTSRASPPTPAPNTPTPATAHSNTHTSPPMRAADPPAPAVARSGDKYTTRAGRRVRFPDRLQIGFSLIRPSSFTGRGVYVATIRAKYYIDRKSVV